MLKITFKSDQIIVSHSKQTILYHQVRQAFSQEFQVQIKIKSGGLHPISKSNQVKSESSDLDFKSNQIDLIWPDFRSFQSDLSTPKQVVSEQVHAWLCDKRMSWTSK